MSAGRGRGYSGRHAAREVRPGGDGPDLHAVRMLSELNPRAAEPKMDKEERYEMLTKLESQMSCDDDAVMKELLTIDDQYAPLLALLEQFSPGEDGIAFNRKLRHFETTISAMCPDESRLQAAFASFRAAALRRASVSRRLATAGACFTRQPRHQPLRAALLNVAMQGTYTKLEVLERANHSFLINAANLMGDYFAEARLCNGNKVHILAAPLMQYLRALLASDELRAHRSLATQLMQNGRELLSVLPVEIDDLSISIRQRLLAPPALSIVWLILSADLCLNKFLPLPNTLQHFYAAQLEFTSEDSHNDFAEVSYGSWKSSETNDVEKASINVSQLNLSQDDDGKPKLRPILGAGAGLLRHDKSQESFDSSIPKYEFPKAEYSEYITKSNLSLSKRYDLNSWRQNNEEIEEPVFNPNVLPPNIDYSIQNTYKDHTNYLQQDGQNTFKDHTNYLQQGDGMFIQDHTVVTQQNSQGDFDTEKFEANTERNTEKLQSKETRAIPDKVDNEVQKSRRHSDRDDPRDERGHTRISPRQRSNEATNEEPRDSESRVRQKTERSNRRNSSTDSNTGSVRSTGSKPGTRRHVTEVPRNNKYWDHDDRCDKDYVS